MKPTLGSDGADDSSADLAGELPALAAEVMKAVKSGNSDDLADALEAFVRSCSGGGGEY